MIEKSWYFDYGIFHILYVTYCVSIIDDVKDFLDRDEIRYPANYK